MSIKSTYITPLLDLFYPVSCSACGDAMSDNELLCLKCIISLDKIAMPPNEYHPAMKRMQGRYEFSNGFAAFYMPENDIMQEIMHKIKYQYKKKLAYKMGLLFAQEIACHWQKRNFDVIIPVPIHKKKTEKRGYNQSALLAQTIASNFQIPCWVGVLIKSKHTASQTSKSRLERVDNIGGSFNLINAVRLQGKHILLVDDVLTTGSTLEACANVLHTIPDVCISFAALTLAVK